MSAPPQELMKLIAGGAGQHAAPGADPMSAAAGGNAAPSGGAMTTPQPKEGVTQAAMISVAVALQQLETALPGFGSATPEGKAILGALKTLTAQFGKDREKAAPLMSAELMQLMQSSPAGGGGNPAAKAMGAMPPGQPAMAA